MAFRRAHAVTAGEDFAFGLFYDDGMPFGRYVERMERERQGRHLEGRVPHTFLMAEVDGEIVGRASIRHELNEFLAVEGGHVGCGVLPGGIGGAATPPRSCGSACASPGTSASIVCW